MNASNTARPPLPIAYGPSFRATDQSIVTLRETQVLDAR